MNIFVLDEDPAQAARLQCNRHVVKMAAEATQLLCSAYEDGTAPMRRSHYNHPCARWARATSETRSWLIEHARALFSEYTRRYNRRHQLEDALDWVRAHPFPIDACGWEPFAQVMPVGYQQPSVVDAYRRYYQLEKRRFAQYPAGEVPAWLSPYLALPPTLPLAASKRRTAIGVVHAIFRDVALVDIRDHQSPGLPRLHPDLYVFPYERPAAGPWQIAKTGQKAVQEVRGWKRDPMGPLSLPLL